MSITCSQLLDSFPQILSYVSGNKEVFIKNVSPAENGALGSVLFISSEKNFMKALQSPASVLVVPESHKDKAKPFIGEKTLLASPNPVLAMAFVTDRFFNPRKKAQGIHPTVVIHPSAQIAKTAGIGPYVVIEENVTIGENTEIMAGTFIGAGTRIGSACEVQPNCTIGSEGYGFAHDQKGHHHRIPQIGIVVIEDDVSIGANCTIDRATFEETKIGKGTKLDNMVHVAHNCKIGEYCLLAAGTMLAGSTTLGNFIVTGGQTAFAGHLTVCDNVQLGGRSGVVGNIIQPGAYSGHPLEPVKDFLRTHAAIKKLTPALKDIKKILKHLGMESSAKDSE